MRKAGSQVGGTCQRRAQNTDIHFDLKQYLGLLGFHKLSCTFRPIAPTL